MTQAKKLKREIRARALKTGESYTAARRHVLLARGNGHTAVPAAPKPAAKPFIANERVVKATGHGLDHWFKVLDAFGGLVKGHTASAAHLLKDHGLRSWWAQMVTVAYERAQGKRVVNQSFKGDFQVGVSRAIKASVEEVAAALSEGRWLLDADPELSAAFPKPARFKNAKLRYRWGASTVQISISAKKGGSTVMADNMKLSGTAEVERRRKQWRGALEALRASLAK